MHPPLHPSAFGTGLQHLLGGVSLRRCVPCHRSHRVLFSPSGSPTLKRVATKSRVVADHRFSFLTAYLPSLRSNYLVPVWSLHATRNHSCDHDDVTIAAVLPRPHFAHALPSPRLRHPFTPLHLPLRLPLPFSPTFLSSLGLALVLFVRFLQQLNGLHNPSHKQTVVY